MTWRSVLIGLAIVSLLCLTGYFARFIVGLGFVGGGLPLVVFASLVLLTLALNPLIAKFCARRVLSTRELAMVVIMGLAVCAYTGSSFYRYLAGSTAIPAYAMQTQTSWQSQQVTSYVPGYVGLIAEGQLRQPCVLAQRVVAEKDADTLAGKLWRATKPYNQPTWIEAADHPNDSAAYRSRITLLVNHAISDPSFSPDPSADPNQRLADARMQLQNAMPDVFVPPPPGSGILFNNGRFDSNLAKGLLISGEQNSSLLGTVPWHAWWPVIRTWVGLMALLLIISFCMAIILRPQWADHEQLSFPIVKFAELMLKPGEKPGLPQIARSGLFWLGFSTLAIHLLNGLHAWVPAVPNVPLQLNFYRLREIFPAASQFWQATGTFSPEISLTVIGFGYLLPRQISLTFGITNIVFLFIGAQLVSHGINPIGRQVTFDGLINFGAMLGLASFLLYTGRNYYRSIAVSAFTFRPSQHASPAAVWSARVLAVTLPLAVLHLGHAGGSMTIAAFAIGLVLLLWLVNARIIAETGLFRLGSTFLPIGIMAAFFGYQSIGPTQIIILTMIGVLFTIELWETPLAYAITGIELAKRSGIPAGRSGPGMLALSLLGLVVTLVSVFAVQYHYGILGRDENVVYDRNVSPMYRTFQATSKLAAEETLVPANDMTLLQRIKTISPDSSAVAWTLAGLALFIGCSIARLRLPWWPIHPLLFVLMGNWGLVTFGPSFLLSWLIKSAMLGAGGMKMYHRVVPLMCGLIAAGLVAGITLALINGLYFILTGIAPTTFGNISY